MLGLERKLWVTSGDRWQLEEVSGNDDLSWCSILAYAYESCVEKYLNSTERPGIFPESATYLSELVEEVSVNHGHCVHLF